MKVINYVLGDDMEKKHIWTMDCNSSENTSAEYGEEEKEKKKPIIDIEVTDKPLWAAAV